MKFDPHPLRKEAQEQRWDERGNTSEEICSCAWDGLAPSGVIWHTKGTSTNEDVNAIGIFDPTDVKIILTQYFQGTV
ncbi:hypothetical protein JTE90_005144 [Oedothorax gibbosus]|uniref:Uncharacterized protein n=1 Tax=Oedothorax gibbosus TaxID=931172 RepID=A0AAV6UNL0_9ARAC|nr:hypothetical protein JTE90_005144 [Oedothorax gibbosus]